MRILFVTDVSLSTVIGGAERVLSEEATRLLKSGHSVYVLTRELPHHKVKKEQINSVEEWRYRFRENPFLSFFKSIFVDCRRTFTSLQEHSSPQVINCHQPFSAAGVLSSRAVHGIPLIYTCLSFSFEEYASRTLSPMNAREWLSLRFQLLGRKLMEKWVLKKSKHIVVLSDFTREKLFEVYGIGEKKVSIIPGGVDLRRFTPPENKALIRRSLGFLQNKIIFFTVRNLVPRMGLENLISAFAVVQNGRRDLLLVVGGEGPLETPLREQARRYGVEESVRFAGYIPDEDLPSYYQMADLFILPTTELEGFGLVTVEALASGLPVLGTPVGGTREILAKLGSNYLFDDSTPQSIAKGILNALNGWATNQAAYKKVSETCRKVAEQHYSWDNHVSKLEDLYYSMIDN
jgi:glycosyltransferase involved in cell wall biosynthesis